jgi:hypothetical protein
MVAGGSAILSQPQTDACRLAGLDLPIVKRHRRLVRVLERIVCAQVVVRSFLSSISSLKGWPWQCATVSGRLFYKLVEPADEFESKFSRGYFR